MAEPILTTKITIPLVRQAMVHRPHLFEKLQQGLKRKLILISAPAGYGKTTLLSSWIASNQIPAAWVSLSEIDDHPGRFFRYMIAAFQTINPEIGASMSAALQTPLPASPLALLPYLINDIAVQREMLFVLDDYHLIKSKEIHEILDFLLRNLPENLHLVIATRADPNLPLSRLRGRQQLVELRSADLRFSSQEAGEFLNTLHTFSLTDTEVSTLNERTDGWVTGLQMAVLSMPELGDSQHFIQSFSASNRYILDYLLEEVLEHQPDLIQSFLLQSSILNQLCSSLCTAVTGNPDSGQILEELERKNLFLIPLDHERQWFRYHPLFADLLQNRLQWQHPEAINELHMKASLWYQQEGSISQAIEHAMSAKAYETAAQLLKGIDDTIWEHGDHAQFMLWMDELPTEIRHQYPYLLVHQAYNHCFSGAYAACEKLLQTVEKNISENDAVLCGMIATTRATYYLYENNIRQAEEYIKTALDCLPKDQHRWRTMALSIYGDVCAYHGYVPTCVSIWQEGLKEAKLTNSLFFTGWLSAKLVFTQRRQGKLKLAARTFRDQIASHQTDQQTQISIAGAFYAVYGDVLVEWNQMDEAIEYIQQGLNLSERQGYMAGIAWSSIALINALYARCSDKAAQEALEQLENKLQNQNLPDWTHCWYTAWKVRILIDRNQFEEAQQVLDRRGITIDGKIIYPREVEYLALGRLWYARGVATNDLQAFTNAKEVLLRLHGHLTEIGWLDKLIKTEILLSLVAFARQQESLAMEYMQSILENTEPEGYIYSFVQEGAPMRRLLKKALQQDLYPAYVIQLLQEFHNTKVPPLQDQLIEPLSAREIDVLRVIATGASNKETALTLHIAIGTVKNHLKNIYGKLSVNSRTQAAARARELRLIE